MRISFFKLLTNKRKYNCGCDNGPFSISPLTSFFAINRSLDFAETDIKNSVTHFVKLYRHTQMSHTQFHRIHIQSKLERIGKTIFSKQMRVQYLIRYSAHTIFLLCHHLNFCQFFFSSNLYSIRYGN